MTPQSTVELTQFRSRAATAWDRGIWLDRCRFDIHRLEPCLGADDVLDLATDLWERPACQLVTPELAVGLLFSDQLRCRSCDSRANTDFSVLCKGAKAGRCPVNRVPIYARR